MVFLQALETFAAVLKSRELCTGKNDALQSVSIGLFIRYCEWLESSKSQALSQDDGKRKSLSAFEETQKSLLPLLITEQIIRAL